VPPPATGAVTTTLADLTPPPRGRHPIRNQQPGRRPITSPTPAGVSAWLHFAVRRRVYPAMGHSGDLSGHLRQIGYVSRSSSRVSPAMTALVGTTSRVQLLQVGPRTPRVTGVVGRSPAGRRGSDVRVHPFPYSSFPMPCMKPFTRSKTFIASRLLYCSRCIA
jgi:hypothetical protein